MKVTYDKEVDAAYIYLADQIKPGEAQKTCSCDNKEIDTDITLDFDSKGILLGIEVLDASKKLRQELLA